MSKSQSTNYISTNLLSEIKDALESVKYGSIEIVVQNRIVTQITVRNIHKTSMEIENESMNSNGYNAHTNTTVKL